MQPAMLSVAVGAWGCAQPDCVTSAINSYSQISTRAAKTVTSDCPIALGPTHFDSIGIRLSPARARGYKNLSTVCRDVVHATRYI